MTTSMKGRWPYYRNCFECGVAARKACRDQADNLAAEPCAGRRLMSEPAEHIEDDVVAPAPEPEPAPVKEPRPAHVGRVVAAAPAPVVIGGHIMAFDDAVVQPTLPVRCLEDELLPKVDRLSLKPARAHPVVACKYCGGDTMRVEYGDCVRPSCIAARKARKAVAA